MEHLLKNKMMFYINYYILRVENTLNHPIQCTSTSCILHVLEFLKCNLGYS